MDTCCTGSHVCFEMIVETAACHTIVVKTNGCFIAECLVARFHRNTVLVYIGVDGFAFYRLDVEYQRECSRRHVFRQTDYQGHFFAYLTGHYILTVYSHEAERFAYAHCYPAR